MADTGEIFANPLHSLCNLLPTIHVLSPETASHVGPPILAPPFFAEDVALEPRSIPHTTISKSRFRNLPDEWEKHICPKEVLCQELLVTANNPKTMCPLLGDEPAIRGSSISAVRRARPADFLRRLAEARAAESSVQEVQAFAIITIIKTGGALQRGRRGSSGHGSANGVRGRDGGWRTVDREGGDIDRFPIQMNFAENGNWTTSPNVTPSRPGEERPPSKNGKENLPPSQANTDDCYLNDRGIGDS
ncbi:hypothetical protein TRIATDRAFT_310190 [Trichoderma atroviride IMI 206040]|uniref:Uncharacterized protein n=1 Tax=Hypocrea atroviridis (strain ATCC 20476 / IMI 206040) TaxID=452589 RepID=G9P208_HYPAI|nr:uncharacterized protein TRIATDRAFT_310190 [Trichoderma atroviride IMI 206040]EHK42603.1 hypothetical protein TRIATDRAFT_310190 [Trichoderma atroviride IMI 206040]